MKKLIGFCSIAVISVLAYANMDALTLNGDWYASNGQTSMPGAGKIFYQSSTQVLLGCKGSVGLCYMIYSGHTDISTGAGGEFGFEMVDLYLGSPGS